METYGRYSYCRKKYSVHQSEIPSEALANGNINVYAVLQDLLFKVIARPTYNKEGHKS